MDQIFKQLRDLEDLVKTIDYISCDWGWHGYPVDTPQRSVSDLVYKYYESKNKNEGKDDL